MIGNILALGRARASRAGGVGKWTLGVFSRDCQNNFRRQFSIFLYRFGVIVPLKEIAYGVYGDLHIPQSHILSTSG